MEDDFAKICQELKEKLEADWKKKHPNEKHAKFLPREKMMSKRAYRLWCEEHI